MFGTSVNQHTGWRCNAHSCCVCRFAVFLFFLFFSGFTSVPRQLGAQGPQSAIPQPQTPLAADLSYFYRQQNDVEIGAPFKVYGSLIVTDAQVTPTDWFVSVEESAVGSGHENAAHYIGWSNLAVNVDPATEPFIHDAFVEAPAVPPFGVVDPVGALWKQEAVPNPAFHMQPLPILATADDWPSYTTAASGHSLARIRILIKFMQQFPDTENKPPLRVAIKAYNHFNDMWVEQVSGQYADWYQYSCMDLGMFDVNYGLNNPFLDFRPEGDVLLQWRVELTNSDGTVVYGSLEYTLLIWTDVFPSA